MVREYYTHPEEIREQIAKAVAEIRSLNISDREKLNLITSAIDNMRGSVKVVPARILTKASDQSEARTEADGLQVNQQIIMKSEPFETR